MKATPPLPRGNHACGHDAGIVHMLRVVDGRGPCGLARADLIETQARLVLDALVDNRYVRRADGLPLPRHWHPFCLVVSDEGQRVLDRAAAAEPASEKAA